MIFFRWCVLILCFFYFFSRTFAGFRNDKNGADFISSLIVLGIQLYAIYWMLMTIDKF